MRLWSGRLWFTRVNYQEHSGDSPIGITRISASPKGKDTLIEIVDNGKRSVILATEKGKFNTSEKLVAELEKRNGGEFSQPIFMKKKPDGLFKIAFGSEPEDW